MAAIKQPDLAEMVRAIRTYFELSQVQFAAKVGVSCQNVNRWENGQTQPLPLALKQIEQSLHQMQNSQDMTLRERGKDLLAKYFSE